MHTLSGLRKNNMGYDLRHLLIGAEGTLGVITAATLRLFPETRHDRRGADGGAGPDAALGLLRLAQARVGAGLSAFEIMHRMGLDFLREVGPEVRHPFDDPPDWMCLIDLGMGAGDDPAGALETLFAEGSRKVSSPTASSPSPRRRGPSSGPCARPSRSPIGGSGRSRRTTSPCPWPRSRASSRKAPGGWRRSGTTGSTASGIWATGTCITMSSLCRAGARGPRGGAARDQGLRA
jgi:hypothetical protein